MLAGALQRRQPSSETSSMTTVNVVKCETGMLWMIGRHYLQHDRPVLQDRRARRCRHCRRCIVPIASLCYRICSVALSEYYPKGCAALSQHQVANTWWRVIRVLDAACAAVLVGARSEKRGVCSRAGITVRSISAIGELLFIFSVIHPHTFYCTARSDVRKRPCPCRAEHAAHLRRASQQTVIPLNLHRSHDEHGDHGHRERSDPGCR